MRRPPYLLLYLYLFSLAFHGFLAWRLAPDLPGQPVSGWTLGLLLALSAWLVPAALTGSRKPHSRFNQAVAWTGFLAMGAVSTLFVLTLLRELALGLLWWVNGSLATTAVQGSAAALVLASLAISLAGFFNARRAPRLVTVDVPLPRLPAALHGFTIVQLTDIHVGPTLGAPWLHRVVAQVNRVQADMIALTGDLVDGRVDRLAPHVAPLQHLQSRHGTFFVTGNHEYYSGAAHWIAHLRTLGLRVLLNEHVVLEQDTATLVVAGVTDHSAHHFDATQRSDPHRAVQDAPTGAPRILLAHQPRSIVQAAAAGFDLQLSGHTHGGQFLPWNWFVPLQQPFTAGLHRHQNQWIYVSRGTGYWGPPKRFGAPAEITVLRLVRTADGFTDPRRGWTDAAAAATGAPGHPRPCSAPPSPATAAGLDPSAFR